MDEFEKMAAIELEETDAAESNGQEPASDYEPAPGFGPELDENAPEGPEEVAVEVAAIVDEVRESDESGSASSVIDTNAVTEEAAPGEPLKQEQAETEKSPHE
jgi:hypothetical protein